MSTYGVARSVTHNFSRRLNPIVKNFKRAPKPDRILFDKKKRPNFYATGIASHLPAAYFKFRSTANPPNYHWVKPAGDWQRHPATGEHTRTDTVPIPMVYPMESQMGLWGGEGIILGYKKSNKGRNVRYKKQWKPFLKTAELYSEILDKEFKIIVTPKTMDLIDEAYGFDYYILKTPSHEMKSLLGMKLKRQMLLALAREDSLYPNDPKKKTKILKRYGKYIVPEEDAEWCGLTRSEAIAKQRRIEAKEIPIRSLQDIYTEELVSKLQAVSLADKDYPIDVEAAKKRTRPFIERLNIFGESSPTDDNKTKS